MFTRLADRLVLMPSRHSIRSAAKTRRQIPFGQGHLEAWSQSTDPLGEPGQADLYILKFSGNASRAELASPHPAEMWSDLRCEVWAINPPGYGGSSGSASLSLLPAVADAAYQALDQHADGRPILLAGNSLGTALALYLAARRECVGLWLRNPVPLRELIYERFGWWNLYLGSALIARQIPRQLDSIANIGQCPLPALFVQSGADTLVPPAFQRRIIEAHAGENRTFVIAGAEHDTPLSERELPAYRAETDWLREAIGL